MTRLVIKLKDGTFINVSANSLDFNKGYIMARNGETVVAIVKAQEIISCYISEQKG